MLADCWDTGLAAVFVDPVLTRACDTLGFRHLHQRDRFWQLLELGAITPSTVISKEERKALADGHATGSVSDPVRGIFLEKKTSQLRRAGIGLTELNRRILAEDEKDKAARPSAGDIDLLVRRAEDVAPAVLAFTIEPRLFVELFTERFPAAREDPGPQPFRIGTAEVWLMGSTVTALRGEALTRQEDTFFALGERLAELRSQTPPG